MMPRKSLELEKRICPKWVVHLFLSLLVIFHQLQSVSSFQHAYLYGRGHSEDFSIIGSEESRVPEIHCSRERSRAAWKILQEYLMPFLEKEGYKITRKCRLHPENDMFRDQEQHKIRLDFAEWKCGYCRKSFYEEKYLDQHFNSRHHNLLNVNHSRCLADICGPLHCDIMTENLPRKTKCNPAAASKNKHLCESVADTCFPVHDGPSASRLHEFFLRQFCDAHTCSEGHKPFLRGRKERTSSLYIAFSILILLLVPLFYVFIYLYQRGMKRTSQELKRISRTERKKKPS